MFEIMSGDDIFTHFSQAEKVLDQLIGKKVLFAISGGLDSCAAFAMLAELRRESGFLFKLISATVIHGLRTEAEYEAKVAGDLASRFAIQHFVIGSDGCKELKNVSGSLQKRARDFRYLLLGELFMREKCNALITAHQADDQLETLMMRLARGSGSSGMSGIRKAFYLNGIFVYRPFLECSRSSFLSFLQDRSIAFTLDPSNHNLDYYRNSWRMFLANMPFDKKTLCANAVALASNMQNVEEAIVFYTNIAYEKCISFEMNAALCSDILFSNYPNEIQRRVLNMVFRSFSRKRILRSEVDKVLYDISKKNLVSGKSFVFCGLRATYITSIGLKISL